MNGAQRPHEVRRRIARAAIATALCVFAAACRDGDSARSAVEVVDSAGIELVRNLYAGFDTTIASLVEELRIGTIDGAEEYQFHRILGINVDGSGRILVANGGTASIRMYDVDGRWVRDFGKRGNGPGEFLGVSPPILWFDSVGVADQEAMRFTLFDTAGTLLTSWPMLLPDRRALYPVGASDAGWAVWVMHFGRTGPRRRPGDETRDTTWLGRMPASQLADAPQQGNAFVDSALSGRFFWLGPRMVYVQTEDGVGGFPPMFAQNVYWATDGPGRFYLSPGPGYQVDVFGLDGRLERRITRAFERILVDDALVDEYIARFEEGLRQLPPVPYDRAGAVRRNAEVNRAEFLPPTRRVLVSDAGELWVERIDVHRDLAAFESIPGAPRPIVYYDVLDPGGHYQLTLRAPDGFTPRWIGTDQVVGILRDENDVEFVVRYRVVRTRPVS